MNIFEQYGGYEVVKQAISNYKQSGDIVTTAGLELQCLEYRREHNIYEVGDVIIHTDFKCVGRFSKYTGKTGTLCYIDFGLGELTVLIKHIRHAADEEIKAGRRL